MKSTNETEQNYYTINLKDFEVKNEFQDLTFKIVNNIEINLSIKVKNIIGGGSLASRLNMFKKANDTNLTSSIISTGAKISIKDRLKMLNNNKNMNALPAEKKNKVLPKKLSLPPQLSSKLVHSHGITKALTIHENEKKNENNAFKNEINGKKENIGSEKNNKENIEKKEENIKNNNDIQENKNKEDKKEEKQEEKEKKTNDIKKDNKEKTQKKEEQSEENIEKKQEEQELVDKKEEQEENKEEKEKKEEKVKEKEEINEEKLSEKKENQEEKKDKNEKEKEEKSENKEEQIENKEEQKENKEEQIENKEEKIKHKEEKIENKEVQIENKEEQKENKEEQIESKEENIENKEEQIENKEAQIENKEERIENKEEQIENKEEQIENKEEKIENKEEQIENKEEQIENKEEIIENKEEQEEKNEEKEEKKEEQIKNKEEQIEIKKEQEENKEEHIEGEQKEKEEKNNDKEKKENNEEENNSQKKEEKEKQEKIQENNEEKLKESLKKGKNDIVEEQNNEENKGEDIYKEKNEEKNLQEKNDEQNKEIENNQKPEKIEENKNVQKEGQEKEINEENQKEKEEENQKEEIKEKEQNEEEKKEEIKEEQDEKEKKEDKIENNKEEKEEKEEKNEEEEEEKKENEEENKKEEIEKKEDKIEDNKEEKEEKNEEEKEENKEEEIKEKEAEEMKENKEIQDKEQQEQEQNKEQENNQNGEIQSENKNEGEENIQDNKEENKVEQESQEKNKDKAQSTEIKNEKKEEEKNEENKIEDSDNEKEPKYNPNKIYLEDDQDEIINIEKETKKKENKKKEKNDKNIVDKKFILRRSHCLNKNRVQELEKKEEEEEEKKKKEDEEKKKKEEIKKNEDIKRGSSIFPSKGFKNIIENMENSKKTEVNNQSKKPAPKKLDVNKFKHLMGERIIGQVIKKQNELLKKKEGEEPPVQNQPISPSPNITEIPIENSNSTRNSFHNSKLNDDGLKLKKSGRENLEKEMEICNQDLKQEQRKKSIKPLDKKSMASNFGFEVLDEFEDTYLQTTIKKICKNTIKEEFLESKNYEEFLSELKKQKKKEEDVRETFCEGFFIASFPKKDGKVIENSAKMPASCGHKECSKLPSMKPEIIMRYPLKDTKNLELNNLAATICFPTGIKLCYSEKDPPKRIKDYVTQITNQKGERYYMNTFHFYHKMQNIDFAKEYENHPLKHHLMKFGDEYLVLSEDQFTDEIINNIQKNLEFCQGLGFRDIVYIPYCICLISKYPYNKEMENCLSTLYKIMTQEPSKYTFAINELIMYLIHSIPIPIKNMRIKFYIPYNKEMELLCPKVDDVSIMNMNFTCLFDYFSVDNIILVFRLLLSEKKILFIHDDYTELSNITNSFISLLYPFKWVHTYIPIMSDQMLKYLETFLPFLNGIHKSLMKLVEDVFKEGELDENDEVFLVYINKGGEDSQITISSSLKKGKIKSSKYIQNNVLPLPFEKDLKKELKNIESHKKSLKRESKTKDIDNHLENRMRDVFIEVFVKMFHDYEKYIGILDDDVVFNKVLFINSKSKDEKFYDEFIDCQLFQQFTQNILKDNHSYFNKKIKEFKEKEKKSKDKKDDKKTSSNKVDSIFIARPDYLGIKDNDKMLIEVVLKDNYKDIKENPEIKNKILEKLNPINPEKYINSNCTIFLTPEKKEKEDENKKKLQTFKGDNQSMIKKASLIAGGELTEKQIDQITDDIKEMAIKIFKSQIKAADVKALKTEAFRNLETSYGRSFFVSLISNNSTNIITLQEDSFNFLENIIYGILTSILKLEETEQIIEEVAILIRSTKFFENEVKKEKNSKKKQQTLFNCMEKRLQNYTKISQKNFWQKWFELDLKKMEDDQDNDKIKENSIINICKEMFHLELSKSHIKNVCDSINEKIFGKDSELYKKTQKSYLDLITHSKYISKAKK